MNDINYKNLIKSLQNENLLLRKQLKEAHKREAIKYKRIKELEKKIEDIFNI